MSMFFFDCSDGDRHLTGEYGVDLRDEAEARDHAAVLVQSLLVDVFPETETMTVAVTVRTTDGPIYFNQCSFTGVWSKEQPPVASMQR